MNDREGDGVQINGVLADVLKLTIDWVKFSEAKSAALIGFNVAAILGVERVSDHLWLWYKVVVLFFLALSAVAALISVIPKVGWPICARKAQKEASDLNLLFYGDIGLLSVDGYVTALERLSGRPLTLTDRWIAAQIVVVSRIVLSKLAMFKFAAYSALAAVLTPVGALIVYGAAEHYAQAPGVKLS